MNPETQRKFQERSVILKAVAHPTRLFIIDRLHRREHNVSELTEMIGASMATVSRHLSIMVNTGIIEYEKRGAMVFYKLRIPCIMDFFSCAEAVLKSNTKKQTRLV